MENANFTCNITEQTSSVFPHFWEHTIGSGHASLALRADWQKQLLRCKKELGFRHVRFHGILSGKMDTLLNHNNELVYSFFNADQVCDFLLSIGMRPFMELSFMPPAISSGNKTVFHYQANVTPPADYEKWGELIFKLVNHWRERYGVEELREWFFEIWNEPNLSAFWAGSQDEYFKLFETSFKAIRKVDAFLKVGGPATGKNAWVTEFIKYCEDHSLPVDFISTHHYPTDAFGQPGDDTKTQLEKSERSILQKDVKHTKAQAGVLPVYYTEWSTSSNPFDDLHDHAYAAAYITKTIMEAREYVDGYSYWTFSDIFEENFFSSKPFHGGFGLMNIYGIPKPAYRAYQLLHQLGDKIQEMNGEHKTVDAWVVQGRGTIQVLLTNSILPGHTEKTVRVAVELQTTSKLLASYLQRIDDTHANATTAWANIGSPGTLSPMQVSTLEEASVLVKESFPVKQAENKFSFEVVIPAQGVALVTLEVEENE